MLPPKSDPNTGLRGRYPLRGEPWLSDWGVSNGESFATPPSSLVYARLSSPPLTHAGALAKMNVGRRPRALLLL
jgi:hypothetical protein